MTIEILLADTKDRLQAPINRYYDTVENLPEGPFRGIRLRIAKAVVYDQFKQVLEDAINAAAVLAGGSPPVDAFPEQWRYAQGFLDSLPDMSREQALVRAAMYLPAIVHVYDAASISYHSDNGTMPELPIRPGDGQTYCGHWCKCTLDIRHISGSDFDVTWTLHPAEHCDDCLTMASLWNPLRIRNGVIIDNYDYSFVESKMRKIIVEVLSQLLGGEVDALPS